MGRSIRLGIVVTCLWAWSGAAVLAAPDPLPDPAGAEGADETRPEPPVIGEPLEPESAPEPPPIPQVPLVVVTQVDAPPPPQEVPEAIYPVRTARLRLASIQGLNAAALGAEVCVLFAAETSSRRCAPAPLILGATVAIATGFAVRPGIDSDHVSAINGGTLIGVLHGGLILGMSGLFWPEDESAKQIGALTVMASSQVVGTLGGHFLYRAFGGSRNGVVDAAVVTSTWSSIVGLSLAMGYADPWDEGANHRRHFGLVLAATDVGLALGVLLGRATEFTAWRSIVVHSYATMSAGLGLLFGVPVMRRDDGDIDEDEVWSAIGWSSLIGFGLGVAATVNVHGHRRMSRVPYAFELTPVRGGAQGSVRGTF